jgi:hypothetical protein
MSWRCVGTRSAYRAVSAETPRAPGVAGHRNDARGFQGARGEAAVERSRQRRSCAGFNVQASTRARSYNSGAQKPSG